MRQRRRIPPDSVGTDLQTEEQNRRRRAHPSVGGAFGDPLVHGGDQRARKGHFMSHLDCRGAGRRLLLEALSADAQAVVRLGELPLQDFGLLAPAYLLPASLGAGSERSESHFQRVIFYMYIKFILFLLN